MPERRNKEISKYIFHFDNDCAFVGKGNRRHTFQGIKHDQRQVLRLIVAIRGYHTLAPSLGIDYGRGFRF